MSATLTNGKPQRKQLADQFDRLDTILDLLAEGLPQAVADATREGARQAVRDVVVELLSNPELRATIAGLAPPAAAPAAAPEPPPPPAAPAPAKPAFWTRVTDRCRAAKAATVRRCRAATATVGSAYRTLAAVMPVKQMLAVGAGVGLAVGVISYACPHGVSAVVGGAGAACTAVAAQVGSWFRRSARLFGFGGTD